MNLFVSVVFHKGHQIGYGSGIIGVPDNVTEMTNEFLMQLEDSFREQVCPGGADHLHILYWRKATIE